jgi:tRNA (uracil-5-)-methyltransferase TRM9
MEGTLEQRNVQEVYENIATHFSETRYKAWPVVDRFFKDLPSHSVGVDVGCGNGKNMRIREDVTCIGFDLYLSLGLNTSMICIVDAGIFCSL